MQYKRDDSIIDYLTTYTRLASVNLNSEILLFLVFNQITCYFRYIFDTV